MAFWRLFPNSAFKRKPIGKSTGGHKKSTGGKTTCYRRPRTVFTIFKVQEWVEKVDEGGDEVLGHLGSTKNH